MCPRGPDKGWHRTFDDAIPLPGGHKLILPKHEHDRPEWRLAAAMPMEAADAGGIVMFAEIAMRRALNADGNRERARRKRARNYRVVR